MVLPGGGAKLVDEEEVEHRQGLLKPKQNVLKDSNEWVGRREMIVSYMTTAGGVDSIVVDQRIVLLTEPLIVA